MEAFSDIFVDQTSAGVKIPKEEYLENGKHIIVDQGQNSIAGYTNRETGLYTDVPAIVFGDHTRIIKYVDKPFFLGADGVKLLKSKKEKANYKYLYYALKNARIPNTGYNRHFKWLKEVFVEYPDADRQKMVVDILDRISEVIDKRHQEIHYLDELIKARFVELFDLNSCKRETLGACTDFVDYRGHTPELSDEGTIRMVNAKSVGKGFFKYVDEYVTEETYDAWMHRGFAYPGDVLFVTEGHTFGNTCLIPDDMTKFALGQRVITIKGHDEIRNAFLCSYMQTDMFWKDINVYRTGGTAQGIRSKDLVKVEIPIPPVEKQDLFMNFVKQVDKSKVAVRKALDETQLLFDDLMQKYFA